jgi:hypothetical protein
MHILLHDEHGGLRTEMRLRRTDLGQYLQFQSPILIINCKDITSLYSISNVSLGAKSDIGSMEPGRIKRLREMTNSNRHIWRIYL